MTDKNLMRIGFAIFCVFIFCSFVGCAGKKVAECIKYDGRTYCEE